jgi:hypothetical protein
VVLVRANVGLGRVICEGLIKSSRGGRESSANILEAVFGEINQGRQEHSLHVAHEGYIKFRDCGTHGGYVAIRSVEH